MTEPEILYEDGQIIVCHKSAGIAVQTRRVGEKDMESILMNHVAAAVPYIGVVHRLDQPVEGVMVFAKTKRAAAALSAQIRERTFGKAYYALVLLPAGKTFAEATGLAVQGTLRDRMLSDAKTNCSRIVPEGTPQAKEAALDYRVLRERDGQALLDIALHTGRRHQIRAQLAHHGAPIAGDRRYGRADGGALALCSHRIVFLHPADGRKMCWEVRPKNPAFFPFLGEQADKQAQT